MRLILEHTSTREAGLPAILPLPPWRAACHPCIPEPPAIQMSKENSKRTPVLRELPRKFPPLPHSIFLLPNEKVHGSFQQSVFPSSRENYTMRDNSLHRNFSENILKGYSRSDSTVSWQNTFTQYAICATPKS